RPDPLLKASGHARTAPVPSHVPPAHRLAQDAEPRADVQLCPPLAAWLDMDGERQPALIQRRRFRRADPCLALERFALVPEHEGVPVDAIAILALLLQGILDLEEIGEVAAGGDV